MRSKAAPLAGPRSLLGNSRSAPGSRRPRGVLHSYADGRIEDTGPLTKKRMETVDEEFLAAALDFMDREHKAGRPFFCWFNSTRMHIFTHLKPESQGKTGLDWKPTGWSSTMDGRPVA
jgi:arylsulfatase A-like enzyme